DDPEIPPFHYGTHYSNAAFVLNWLFRLEPFTTFYLQLNDGKIFENVNSNRLFHSIEETWEHCLTDTHDVKELIPELFYLTEMFLFNENNCCEEKNLGIREDGNKIGNVILPKWANGKAEEFVKIHRKALESDLAQVRQVIYGHGDVVTCLARSETTLFADSYIASGSADCTVVLWHFSQNTGTIAGEFNSVGELPVPRAILTGHEAVITAITVSAEHGLVISGAK
uniref:BEACH domain-containing protein n=1 Tax=Meloidogyne javanica TaxID=6303 RepID=A0A915LTE0_MELJA